MLRRTTLARVAIPATAALAVGLAIPALTATADTSAAETCVQAGNVWVHVAYDDVVTGACATEFATAQDAIASSGVSTDEGWIQTVDGRLADGTTGTEWWSVYSLTADEHGTYNVAWDFAQVGVAELELAPSAVLALQLQEDWNVDAVEPAVNPVADVVLGSDDPAPEPTATPTVEATASPTPSPVVKTPTRPGPPKTGN